jgi:hypothetical protein
MNFNKNIKIFILIYILALFSVTIFSERLGIHDTGEYITIAKAIAGIQNVDLFSAHSIIYPIFLASFIKIFPSMITIKIMSALWLIATSLLLRKFWGNKALILFALSPVVWFTAIEVSPILPVAFFFTLSYYYIDKWKTDKKLTHLIYGSFFSGFCVALWGGALIIPIILFLVYFLKEKKSSSVIFFILNAVGYIPRLVSDQVIFGYFLQSTIRYFGVNVTMLMGLGVNKIQEPTIAFLLEILFLISPLLVMIYLKYNKQYKKEIWIISIFLIFFYLRTGRPIGLKYFLVIAPLVMIVLSKVLTDKQILIAGSLGILLTILLILPVHFSPLKNSEELYTTDLEKIHEELGYDTIIAGPSQALTYATVLWENEPKIIWYEDYKMSQENEEVYSIYEYQTPKTKLFTRKVVTFQGGLKSPEQGEYSDIPIVSVKTVEINEQGYKLKKCYTNLCVYTTS